MFRGKRVIVVLPARNAAATLERTLADIPGLVDERVLVDNNSRDATVAIATREQCTVIRHPEDRGYGASQKTGYRVALEHGADYIIMIHPDYQYDPTRIPLFLELMGREYDVVLGSRIRTRAEALGGGMPIYKYLANRCLTLFENLVSGYNLSEWHTGMRSYRRSVLEAIDFESNSNDFVFDSQLLFQVVEHGFRIGELPVPVRYFPEASSINVRRSIVYGVGTVCTALRFLVRRLLRRGRQTDPPRR